MNFFENSWNFYFPLEVTPHRLQCIWGVKFISLKLYTIFSHSCKLHLNNYWIGYLIPRVVVDFGKRPLTIHGADAQKVWPKKATKMKSLIKACSPCALFFLIATSGLYRSQWKCSHYVTTTTWRASIQPIVSKTNRSCKLHSVTGPLRVQSLEPKLILFSSSLMLERIRYIFH